MTKKMCKKAVHGEGRRAFVEFKAECLRQIDRLGLKDWDISIKHESFDGDDCNDQANASMMDEGRVAVVALNKNYTGRPTKGCQA